MKANFNPTILAILLQEVTRNETKRKKHSERYEQYPQGASIDAVSPVEVELAMKVGFSPSHILFTGNNVGRDDLEYCLDKGMRMIDEELEQR